MASVVQTDYSRGELVQTVDLPEGVYSNASLERCVVEEDTFFLTFEMDRMVDGVESRLTQQTLLTILSEKTMELKINPSIDGNKLLIRMETNAKACKTCGVYNMPGRPKVKLFRCGQCLDPCYCSRACQTADWVIHKPQCRRTVP
jgi:hypothetical protein